MQIRLYLGQVTFCVQWRDGDDARLDQMRDVMQVAANIAAELHGLSVQRSNFFSFPSTRVDEALMAKIRHAAKNLAPELWRQMPSGALHDASNVATHLPVAMLFVPSIGGVSHCFSEDTTPNDLILGCTSIGGQCDWMTRIETPRCRIRVHGRRLLRADHALGNVGNARFASVRALRSTTHFGLRM